jgi:hypothetical protein
MKEVKGNIKELKGESDYLDCTYVGHQDKKGNFDGLFQIFRDGKLIIERTYSKGEMTGKYIEYNKDGTIYKGNRLKGERHGEFKTIDPEDGELDVEYYNMGTRVKSIDETLIPFEKTQKEQDLENLRKKDDDSILNEEMKNIQAEIDKGPRKASDIKKDITPISEDDLLNTAAELEKHIEQNPKKSAHVCKCKIGVVENDLESLTSEYLSYVRQNKLEQADRIMEYMQVILGIGTKSSRIVGNIKKILGQ